MTISNQDARTGPYNGNGSTTSFAYDFKVIDEDHLVVTLKNSSDVETVQTITTNYTVTGVGAAGGGTVEMVTAPASGETLTISRAVPLTQEVDLANRGGVQPEVLETAYDKLTQALQDQEELHARVPRFPVSSSLTNVELPLALTAGAALKVNSTADGFENGPTADQITSAQSYAEAAQAALDEFTDLYLGAKASDPALDNDGNALQNGALYFNTTSNELKIYNGSAWQVAAVSAAGLLAAANNLSDLASAATARTNLGVAIGSDVQAFDADTAKTDVAQTFTVSQRGTITTDNDLSFDIGNTGTNNWKCTPTGSGTLTFTNHTAGQSGNILLDNSGGHAISLAATTKGDANLATTISAAGTYWLSYYDDGSNAYVVTSAVFA